jgi:PAS domain-containing protein
MSEHDEVYGRAREAQLLALLKRLAERIRELDGEGRLLAAVPELQRLLGDARSELFHYEVRSTYDTPEIADSRRIVDEAASKPFTPDTLEDDEPWRPPQGG